MDKFNEAIKEVTNTIKEMQWEIDGVKRQAKHDRVVVLVLLASAVVSALVIFSVSTV